MTEARIIYAQGRPYGAPLVLIRGGATRLPIVRERLQQLNFQFSPERHGWATYLDTHTFAVVLRDLRDRYHCNVVPKDNLKRSYIIDLNAHGPDVCDKCAQEAAEGWPMLSRTSNLMEVTT